MDLFKRLPKIRPARNQSPLIKNSNKYPALAADFQILEEILLPSYYKYDGDALSLQNAYWWTYVILIVGGTCATIFGILQLAFNIDAFGIAGAIVAAFLGSTTIALNSFRYQERYMNSRLVAEELRGEYFLFLGHIGEYKAEKQERIETLRERVRTIEESAEV